MGEAITYPNGANEKSQARASIKAMLEEMDHLHQENEQSRERIRRMDEDIDASLANIDAILARLAAT